MKTRTSIGKSPSDDDISHTDELMASSAESTPSLYTDTNKSINLSHRKAKRSSFHQSRRKAKQERPLDFPANNEHFVAEEIDQETHESNEESTSTAIDYSVTNNNSDSAQIRKCGEKKGRNLDLVVRRMLKAKKKSENAQINSSVIERDSTKPATALPEGNILVLPDDTQERNIIKNEGMIDVQLTTDSQRLGNFPNESSIVQRQREGSPPADVINDSCSSHSSESPTPFVSNRSTKSPDRNMSPVIKQEPVCAMNSRLALYHTNEPNDTHSPSSSYGSQPSPIRRSPSPSSPGGQNSRNLPSPPELIQSTVSQSEHHSANALLSDGVGSFIPNLMSSGSSSLGYSAHTPNGHSLRYNDDTRRSPGVTAAAMAASGIGLPTLVPPMSAIPQNVPPHVFSLSENSILPRSAIMGHYAEAMNNFQQRRNESDSRGPKVSPNAPVGPNPPRGIVGQKEAAAANEARNGGGRRRYTDEKCPYKRPPHTYPALIASAILDSPGNLITLRGIYDYIMNNFPYYKFGHDKSAWQNSIRHNLSLNQCFVKVPRYENAAKSNYWTMTREGFEEFGNENSFKRRRRRGAALAPISAYKNKKYGNQTNCANANRSTKQRNTQDNNSLSNGIGKGDFMNWGGRARTPEPNVGYRSPRDSNGMQKSSKRAGSPGIRVNGTGPKHPRMIVLKHGEGPSIEGLGRRNDHPQRPNSLSSVEEMQGNLNSFSKSLSGSSDGNNGRSPNRSQGRSSPASQPTPQQQWMMAAAAAHKNLYAAGLIPPSLISASSSSSPPLISSITSSSGYPITSQGSATDSQAKLAGLGTHTLPVLMDHIEIGSQVPLYVDNGGSVSTWSFACRFCDYKCIEESPAILEQHCRVLHQLEITKAKAKAVAVAAVAGPHQDRESRGLSKSPIGGQDPNGSLMSLQSMVSGFPPSMLAAAAGYSNAQSLLAAAGLSLPVSQPAPMSNPATSTPSYFTDPIMRSLAQQMASGEGQNGHQLAALNNSLQQASGSLSPDQQQLRQMVYHQLLLQNPFFAGNPALAAAMPRQMATGRSDISTFAQLWQYQQRMLEMTSQSSNDKATDENEKAEPRSKLANENGSSQKSPNRNRKSSSSSNASHENGEGSEKSSSIHSWKQCQDCDFTAKGNHGLELHFRKAHANENSKQEGKESRNGEQSFSAVPKIVLNEPATEGQADKIQAEIQSPRANVMDLSGAGVAEKVTSSSTGDVTHDFTTASTQTDDNEMAVVAGKRSCPHCDVTFGDDTMHALHMSCHDRVDPFKCTICGQACHEKYYFNVHLLRGLHQQPVKKMSRDEGPEVKYCRRHSNSSEKSVTSVSSEGIATAKESLTRSASSLSLPEVTDLPNGDVIN